jgi:hypothetical protein
MAFGTWQSSTGCSDGAAGDGDATVHGDAGTDGWVDLGPIDCEGTPPTPDATCIKGQVYDFGADKPMNVPGDVRVASVTTSWFEDESTMPDLSTGLVRRDGKFATWQNEDVRGLPGGVLYLLDEIDGYLPGAVNVYFGFTQPFGSVTPRLYSLSETRLAHWAANYPGEADLTTFRPLILGLLKSRAYTDLEGPYRWWWGDGGPFGFDQQGIFWELTALTPERLSFLDLQHQYEGTSTPAGGTQLLLLDPDHVDYVHLTFYELAAHPVEFGTRITQEMIDTNLVSYLIMHFSVWWDIGQ